MNGLTPGGKTRVDVAILERKDSKSGKAEFYVQEANNAGKVGIIHYVVEYGRNKTDIKQIYDNKPISPMIKTLEP